MEIQNKKVEQIKAQMKAKNWNTYSFDSVCRSTVMAVLHGRGTIASENKMLDELGCSFIELHFDA